MQNRFLIGTLTSVLILIVAGIVAAQGLPPMGPPIPTVIVVSKPAPGEVYGNKPVITLGVQDKIYKFVLKDAYVNHRFVRWPDVWQDARQYNPNFQVQGQGEDKFAKIEPGQTYTVSGFYAPMNHTFEVDNFHAGSGPSGESHY